MKSALDGIRVLEFSEIVAAPFGGMILADLGADVIKVEPPQGEPWRVMGAFAPGESGWFISLNRGKRGLAIDLKTEQGRAAIHKLAATADVVIINYRPDAPKTLGVDYETLSAINERLIYVQNTAFGPNGPHANRPGYDIVAQAYTGLMATDGKTNDAGLPAPMNPPMADFGTGMTIVAAVCAALLVRDRTGEGQKIEASLMATALAMQGWQFLKMEAVQPVLSPAMQRIQEAKERGATWLELQEIEAEIRGRMPGMAYYRTYETADGIIVVACLAPSLYRKFSAAIDVPDGRFAEDAPKPGTEESLSLGFEFTALCEARMREKTTDEWIKILDAAGVPTGPFRTMDDLRTDPQVLDNGLLVELDHPVAGKLEMFGPVFTMSKSPSAIGRPSPTIGQHNDELLAEIGYSPEQIAALRTAGTIR